MPRAAPARVVSITLVLGVACGGGSTANDAAAIDAGPTYTLPAVAARCAAPADRSTRMLAVTDPVPVLALARGTTDLGLAYVARTAFPQLAHFELQRLTTAGATIGAPIVMSPVDMAIPGAVSVTHDGSAYLACTVIVGGASCFRVDAAGASHDDAMVLDATAIAIANGAGGVVGAWIRGGELNVGPLAGSTGVVATTESLPSIAPTETGYVVGYTIGGTAYVVMLDASGVAGTPIALGPARMSARVAVSFTAGHVGASYIGPSGDAMAAVVTGGAAHALTIGAGAMSHGQISIARASDGFFATWSDLGGAFVDLDGTVTGARYSHVVAWADDAHAVIATGDGFVLATNTTAGATPVDVAVLGCP